MNWLGCCRGGTNAEKAVEAFVGAFVSAGSCFGLPPRSLLSHPGHQRSQFTPLNGTEVTLCSFCSYLHKPSPCILGGWSLCADWASFGTVIAPHSPRFIPTHSTLA